MRLGVGVPLGLAFLLLVPACGSGTRATDGAPPGMCSADVPAGQECNTLANVGDLVTPTCVTGTAPSGTGGTLVDGTYVLTSQDKYGSSCTSPFSFSETLAVAGDCIQVVSGGILPATASVRITTQGNAISFTQTCVHVDTDGAVVTPDMRMKSYTAASTTLTLFAVDATTGNTDVSVFTRR